MILDLEDRKFHQLTATNIMRDADRRPKRGYRKKNCVSCCYTCNRAKNTMSLQNFTTWIQRIVLKFGK